MYPSSGQPSTPYSYHGSAVHPQQPSYSHQNYQQPMPAQYHAPRTPVSVSHASRLPAATPQTPSIQLPSAPTIPSTTSFSRVPVTPAANTEAEPTEPFMLDNCLMSTAWKSVCDQENKALQFSRNCTKREIEIDSLQTKCVCSDTVIRVAVAAETAIRNELEQLLYDMRYLESTNEYPPCAEPTFHNTIIAPPAAAVSATSTSSTSASSAPHIPPIMTPLPLSRAPSHVSTPSQTPMHMSALPTPLAQTPSSAQYMSGTPRYR